MQLWRQRAIAAASGLVALLASGVLLGTAAGATDQSRPTESACLDNSSYPTSVKVQLSDPGPAENTYQVGLAGPARDANQYPDGGGPSLVSVGSTVVTVQLAGPVLDGDHVFVTGDGALATNSLQISGACVTNPVADLKLKDPYLAVAPAVSTEQAQQLCGVPTADGLAVVTLQNNNVVDPQFEKATGMNQIPYTVILVRSDTGAVSGDGALLRFDGPDTRGACIATDSTKAANYQVRAIAVDGSVESAPVKLSAALPTTHPTKPSPHPTPSHTASQPVPNPGGSGSSGTVTPPGGTGSVPGSSGSAGNSSSSASSRPSATRSVHPLPSPDNTSGPPVTPSPSASPSYKQLAEPRLANGSRIFVWQSAPAMIVLIDALAISALIGCVVWSAKRR